MLQRHPRVKHEFNSDVKRITYTETTANVCTWKMPMRKHLQGYSPSQREMLNWPLALTACEAGMCSKHMQDECGIRSQLFSLAILLARWFKDILVTRCHCAMPGACWRCSIAQHRLFKGAPCLHWESPHIKHIYSNTKTYSNRCGSSQNDTHYKYYTMFRAFSKHV